MSRKARQNDLNDRDISSGESQKQEGREVATSISIDTPEHDASSKKEWPKTVHRTSRYNTCNMTHEPKFSGFSGKAPTSVKINNTLGVLSGESRKRESGEVATCMPLYSLDHDTSREVGATLGYKRLVVLCNGLHVADGSCPPSNPSPYKKRGVVFLTLSQNGILCPL